jgi:hypothetical protein
VDIAANLFLPVLSPPLLSPVSPLRLAVVVFHLLHRIHCYLLSLLLLRLLLLLLVLTMKRRAMSKLL